MQPDAARALDIIQGHNDAFKGVRVTRFLGLTSATDHTAETQLEGWKEMNAESHKMYNDSPRGQQAPVNPRTMPSKLTAANTDHAADQKKLAQGTSDWKIESERIVRGEQEAKTWRAEDLMELLIDENVKKLDSVGGLAAFGALSSEEQATRNKAMLEQVCACVGQKSFDAMSPEQQRAANLFIWAGCCMHKELNAVKGGDVSMKAFWITAGLIPPVKLMNIDNAWAAASGSSAAKTNAESVSQGGGTKLTSLAGAIFNHKDEKKGQADTYRIFFERELGYMISFPDTSNTRCGSHCLAAAELLVHRELYIKLLAQVWFLWLSYSSLSLNVTLLGPRQEGEAKLKPYGTKCVPWTT